MLQHTSSAAGMASALPPGDGHFDHAFERAHARAYIDACAACGLILHPWRVREANGQLRDVVFTAGLEMDGPNDFSAGTHRLLAHPDGRADEGCRPGLIFATLCADFGVAPDDPAFFAKINARCAAICAESLQVAS